MPQVGGTTASLEICVILIQSENASCPILCNPLPKVKFFRLLQAEKAHLPMLLTLSPIDTFCRLVQP